MTAMAERKVKPGDVVIQEGQEGDFFYAVDTGKFVAIKDGETKFVYDGSGKAGKKHFIIF